MFKLLSSSSNTQYSDHDKSRYTSQSIKGRSRDAQKILK